MSPDASSRPAAVLFACNFNRVRSPMAEALLKRLIGDRIYVDSCGLKYARNGEPTDGVDPFAEFVMAELGCNLAGHQTKIFEDLADDSFDLVISFTPEAQHRAVEYTRGRAAELEYWPIFDPTLTEGPREARLAAYREVRDALAARIAARFGK
jgi:protein-tyrosine-phosphatase